MRLASVYREVQEQKKPRQPRDGDEGDAPPEHFAITPRHKATMGKQANGKYRNIRRERHIGIARIAGDPKSRCKADYQGGDKENQGILDSTYPHENERERKIEWHFHSDRPASRNDALVQAGDEVK